MLVIKENTKAKRSLDDAITDARGPVVEAYELGKVAGVSELWETIKDLFATSGMNSYTYEMLAKLLKMKPEQAIERMREEIQVSNPDKSTDKVCATCKYGDLTDEDTYKYCRDARSIVQPHGNQCFGWVSKEDTN